MRGHLDTIARRYPDAQPARIIGMLAVTFGDSCSELGDNGVLFHKASEPGEFLETPSGDVVSSQHAFWQFERRLAGSVTAGLYWALVINMLTREGAPDEPPS